MAVPVWMATMLGSFALNKVLQKAGDVGKSKQPQQMQQPIYEAGEIYSGDPAANAVQRIRNLTGEAITHAAISPDENIDIGV